MRKVRPEMPHRERLDVIKEQLLSIVGDPDRDVDRGIIVELAHLSQTIHVLEQFEFLVLQGDQKQVVAEVITWARERIEEQ